MWRRVALVRTGVSEEPIAPIIRVKRISKLGNLAVTSNWSTLRYVPPKYQFLQEPQGILHNHRRENLKSYTVPYRFTDWTRQAKVQLDSQHE
jgi:hypothetical protein